MHTLVVLFGHPRNPEAFRRHYRSVHLPLVRNIPGVRELRASEELGSSAGTPPYFALFEADFDDGPAMQDALTTAEGQAANADIPNFATGGLTVFTYRR
ncbi:MULTISPECIES: EthD family reductase [unclassified Arthrobacter]|uniref:EthD family reductase n=1 Tax=unclassified Arthrobacter TaxID=235627 RepID=UPI001E2B08FD|nr:MULTISPECIES: EthD family reductase [unclassified Arthrobacter]MCC9144598.1 EthD family reductase [Arthrobacter sp. zg-Y919]MDK1275824.1 EthD family reductase [Arthrobacter sp. zg.Y919]WIB02813.1 EthD family reductase [Arthrobacter sp. zg-Y919]